MSSTGSNDSSPSFLIPSPQELSDIFSDEYTLEKIERKFRRRPNDHALLRYYNFLSITIDELELSLERAQMERESIHDHLFESRKFYTRIRPLIEDFRQRRAIRQQTSHPYGRPNSSNSTSEELPVRSRSPNLPYEPTHLSPPTEFITEQNGERIRSLIDEDLTGTSPQHPIVVYNKRERPKRKRKRIQVSD